MLDSRADDEFDECRLKARFLTGLDPGFELFETMLATPAGELPHLRAPPAIAWRAARALLGFAFDAEAARAALLEAAALLVPAHRDGCAWRWRTTAA